MIILIDTHVFLWMISAPNKLSDRAKDIIESTNNEVFLSVVSGWEITTKAKINKLKLPEKPEIYIPEQIQKNFIEILPIEMKHVLNIYNLPGIHKDHFDRLLISQSQLEDLPILTNDEKISRYPVKTIW